MKTNAAMLRQIYKIILKLKLNEAVSLNITYASFLVSLTYLSIIFSNIKYN